MFMVSDDSNKLGNLEKNTGFGTMGSCIFC